jgi:hypothetical protein
MGDLIFRIENPVESRDRIEDFDDRQRAEALTAVLADR